jgi:3-oxoacyl-[acyl-carrier protein] reductase
MKLSGKAVLITGAARGIGRAIAKLFAREGAKVAINYSQSENEAMSLAEEIKQKGGEALLVKADVSKSEQVKEMVRKTLEKFGRIDVLVNNAGVIFRVDFLNSDEGVWDKTMNINLKGAYLCSKEVAPVLLKQKKGKIINIASISGMTQPSAIRYVEYAASKAGVIGLTRSLAVNLGPKINVNAVSPGFIETDMTAPVAEESRKKTREETLLKRFGKPEEIANAALFLASDESDFMTGEVITVAGGRAMR